MSLMMNDHPPGRGYLTTEPTALALNPGGVPVLAESGGHLRQIGRYQVRVTLAGDARQWLDVVAHQHQHRCGVYAPLGRDAPGLRRLVYHCGKLEGRVERVLARHDSACP